MSTYPIFRIGMRVRKIHVGRKMGDGRVVGEEGGYCLLSPRSDGK